MIELRMKKSEEKAKREAEYWDPLSTLERMRAEDEQKVFQ